MIQQISHAGKRVSQLTEFILITSKWIQIADKKAIYDCIAACTNAANANSLFWTQIE